MSPCVGPGMKLINILKGKADLFLSRYPPLRADFSPDPLWQETATNVFEKAIHMIIRTFRTSRWDIKSFKQFIRSRVQVFRSSGVSDLASRLFISHVDRSCWLTILTCAGMIPAIGLREVFLKDLQLIMSNFALFALKQLGWEQRSATL